MPTSSAPSWSDIVPVPPHYSSQRCTIPGHHRAISLYQLEQLGDLIERVLEKRYYDKVRYVPKRVDEKRAGSDAAVVEYDPVVLGKLTKINISMYEINDLFVKPLTCSDNCSFTELIAEKDQPPTFFVSHYWGTPFFDTLRILKLHARHRNMDPKKSFYWICTFANNQHSLEELTTISDPLDTPFAKALLTCQGTVMILDEYLATPFTRVWCIYELFLTTQTLKRHHVFDVATIIPALECENDLGLVNHRCAGILLDGGDGLIITPDMEVTDHEGHDFGTTRAWFPARVAKLGFLTDIRQGQASRDEDREWILSIIKGNEENVNRAVKRKLFRTTLYRAATSLGNLELLTYTLKSRAVTRDEALELANQTGIVADTAAWSSDRSDCLEFLLEYGCDPNILSKPQRHTSVSIHPLEAACRRKNSQHVLILLRYNADPHYKYEDGSGLGVEENLKEILVHPQEPDLVKRQLEHLWGHRAHIDSFFKKAERWLRRR